MLQWLDYKIPIKKNLSLKSPQKRSLQKKYYSKILSRGILQDSQEFVKTLFFKID